MLSFITHSLNIYSVLEVEELNDKDINTIIKRFRVRRQPGNKICVEQNTRVFIWNSWSILGCVKRK